MQEEREKKMKKVIIRGVPYHPQFSSNVEDRFKNRACTFASLKMGAEFVTKRKMPSINELFKEGTIIQQDLLDKGRITPAAVSDGFLHDVVLSVAHNHGVPAHKEEFRSMQVDLDAEPGSQFSSGEKYNDKMYGYGLKRIYESIDKQSPVIVSVRRNFDPTGTAHSVLIVGYDEGSSLYYHDPDSTDADPRVDSIVPLHLFEKCWRRLAIFVDALPE